MVTCVPQDWYVDLCHSDTDLNIDLHRKVTRHVDLCLEFSLAVSGGQGGEVNHS